MPLTVFETKGIPGARRERIEAAVEAGGKHLSGPYEAWITSDPFRGGVKVTITGPQGFERTVGFAMDEGPGGTQERARETVEVYRCGSATASARGVNFFFLILR
jgi:hypothetical protein